LICAKPWDTYAAGVTERRDMLGTAMGNNSKTYRVESKLKVMVRFGKRGTKIKPSYRSRYISLYKKSDEIPSRQLIPFLVISDLRLEYAPWHSHKAFKFYSTRSGYLRSRKRTFPEVHKCSEASASCLILLSEKGIKSRAGPNMTYDK
jgi:hypothetical protein